MSFKPKRKQKGFSIQLVSKNYLDVVSISEKADKVLIEGRLGDLQEINFIDNMVLVATYSMGVLRLDITLSDIQSLIVKEKRVINDTQEYTSTDSGHQSPQTH